MSEGAARPVIAILTALEEYQSQLIRAAQRVLATRDIPLVAHCEGPIRRGVDAKLLVSLLRDAAPVGVLSLNSMDQQGQDALLALLTSLDLPAVHLGLDLPGQTCVRGDSERAMRELMFHVLDDRRARTVALVRGIPHHPDSMIRERVFREQMAARSLPVDEELVVTGNFAPEATYRELRRVLPRRDDVDAIVALNDRSGLAAIDAVTDAGLRVPEDVAVTGFDNDATAANWPGLTSVDQGIEQQGEIAASLLLDRIDGSSAGEQVVVPARVVVRGSTSPKGSPAVTDLVTAVAMARTEKEQLAAQDGIVAMSLALDYCWTVADVVEVLDTHLPRLGVTRGFLALYERSHTEEADAGLSVRVSTDRVHLVLDHREGRRHAPPADSYPAHQLLPDELVDQRERGPLVLQPLAVLDRSLGFILFEQAAGPDRLTELMRIDLSRALDGVLATQEARTHAAMLERVVARRTQELRKEVMTRRRAERDLQRANQELHRSARLDGLTQIANRSAFQHHLEMHWATTGQLALLMVDVDNFKAYNDHYGHILGDEALRTVASCLERAVWGDADLACRYGGEEFAVVLPRSGIDAAVAVAQRFQQSLADAAIPHAASPVAPVLTASIGIAVTVPELNTDPHTLLEAADQAMYRAKTLGRNRIQLGSHGAPPRRPHHDRTGVIGHGPASSARTTRTSRDVS